MDLLYQRKTFSGLYRRRRSGTACADQRRAGGNRLLNKYDKTDLIYLFAQAGGDFSGSKEIIYHIIKTVSDKTERAAKIASVYGAKSAQSFIKRIICGYSYDAHGVALRYRDLFGQLHEVRATWEEVAAQIERAIAQNDYFSA